MPLRVEAVEGRRGTARFIDVPWHIYSPSAHPHWIPPLRITVRDNLDTRGNPFYRKAAIRLFVASRGARPVGRIAAVENRWHNERHGDRVGFFGFFECVDDAEVAGRLLEVAEAWLRERGLAVARGPVSPSMNHECGLLVDGFDDDPMVFTPWNPPYYRELLERAGYAKAKDVLAFQVPMGSAFQVPERLARHAERARERSGVVFRDFDFGHFGAEVRQAWEIYRAAWADNWGFVPPDLAEFRHLAAGLKLAARRRFCFVAEMDGEAVGFMIIVGDLNRVFRSMRSGRLGPLRLLRILWSAQRLRSGRVILLGLKPEARRRGLFSVFVHEAMRRGKAIGATGAEASWVLEDNEALLGPLRALGLPAYRRWRIYDKPLAGSGAPR